MKKGLPTVKLVDTRKTVDLKAPHLAPVPTDETINNGAGALRYLAKRHSESGKPVFYWPADWSAMSEAQKLAALDHRPVVDQKAKRTASELEASFDSAGPLAQDALLERLMPRIMARIGGAPAASVPAPKGKA